MKDVRDVFIGRIPNGSPMYISFVNKPLRALKTAGRWGVTGFVLGMILDPIIDPNYTFWGSLGTNFVLSAVGLGASTILVGVGAPIWIGIAASAGISTIYSMATSKD